MLLVSYIQQYFNTSITVLTNQDWKLLIALFKVPNTGVFTVNVTCIRTFVHCTHCTNVEERQIIYLWESVLSAASSHSCVCNQKYDACILCFVILHTCTCTQSTESIQGLNDFMSSTVHFFKESKTEIKWKNRKLQQKMWLSFYIHRQERFFFFYTGYQI